MIGEVQISSITALEMLLYILNELLYRDSSDTFGILKMRVWAVFLSECGGTETLFPLGAKRSLF